METLSLHMQGKLLGGHVVFILRHRLLGYKKKSQTKILMLKQKSRIIERFLPLRWPHAPPRPERRLRRSSCYTEIISQLVTDSKTRIFFKNMTKETNRKRKKQSPHGLSPAWYNSHTSPSSWLGRPQTYFHPQFSVK